ncbi:MAG: SDR family oxidoreductase [Pseudomonadota bacterium]
MGSARGRKSIFITGAASGIGAETARLFSKKGWFTGLYDIDQSGLQAIVDEIGPDNCISQILDVRNRDQWDTAIETFGEATEGAMNVLFNNAGIGRHGWFEEIPQDDADAVIDVNVKGVINGIYASMELLSDTAGARIVNVASTAGFVGSPQLAVYSASKFAVRGLTEALDVEFSGLDIKVTSLAPWFIDTPILDMGKTDMSNEKMSDQLKEAGTKVYPVSLAAEGAWSAAHGKQTHYTVGRDASRARFMARFFPGLIRRMTSKALEERSL